MEVTGSGRRGKKKEYLFSGYRVSVLQDEKVLEICITAMSIYLTLMNGTLKNGKNGKFYNVVLSTTIKKKHKQNPQMMQHLCIAGTSPYLAYQLD